jgi:hypothetical protein
MRSADQLDDLWERGLTALADPPSFSPEPRERVVVRATKQRRDRRIGRAVALVAVAVIAFGAVAVVATRDDPSHTTSSPSYVEPIGVPVATVTIDATPSLRLQPDLVTVPKGIVELRFRDEAAGQHVLAIERLPGFRLTVNDAGQTETGKVDLQPGRYTIYCAVPGHADAGERATLIVEDK